MKKALVVILAILAIAGMILWQSSQKNNLPIENLELADDDTKRARGLMGRSNLCPNCGMLFVFTQDELRSFWMRNTPTSLDIIYINSKGIITNIHKSTTPNSDTAYTSDKPAQYALEMPAGYAERNNLKAGVKVDVGKLQKQAQ